MSTRIAAAAVLSLALLLAACGGDGGTPERAEEPTPTAPERPAFERATAVIEMERGSVEVDVEVAETPAQREFGLMYRESLPAEAGMVFLYESEATGGFWMKNTLIPLSIAFFDEDGTILRILAMDPCVEDPCPIYDPGVSYHGALEVNQGAFADWGVSEGDRIRVER